ncbi:MAG: hypothetical protein KGZ88_04785 [Methylomicrobium sp.]|nr:hypothetical protein [Methylomicrobium sp.]
MKLGTDCVDSGRRPGMDCRGPEAMDGKDCNTSLCPANPCRVKTFPPLPQANSD